MIRLTKLLWRQLRAARHGVQTRHVDDAQDALRLAYWADKPALRMELPVDMLRTQGGFTVGPDHPFCRALSDGSDFLTRYYDRFAPETLGALHGIDSALPPWRLPWRLLDNPAPPPGEAGLSASHGVAFYGPCSPEKVRVEMKRLRSVAAGINAHGFNPDRYGDIEGHLMTDGARTVFFVMGGKHRAAAMAHLGKTHVPVAFRATHRRVVDCRQVDDWPMVVAGEVSRADAMAIAQTYLTGRGASDVLAGEGGDIGE